MSVTLTSTTSHGLYGSALFTTIRVRDLVDKVWAEGQRSTGQQGAYAIPLTLEHFMSINHGHEGFCDDLDFDGTGEDDCLVILSSFAPGGSEWGNAPHNLEDVGRFFRSIREASVAARIQAELHEEGIRK